MSSDGDGKKSLVVGSLAAARGEVKKPRATAEDAPTMRYVVFFSSARRCWSLPMQSFHAHVKWKMSGDSKQ